jgi:hypothetical protein
VIQLLSSLAAHSLALLIYPGLLTILLVGALPEVVWTRLIGGGSSWRGVPQRRPTPVQSTIAVGAILASVQVAAPFSPMPTDDRSVVIAAVALAFTAWADLALTVEHVPDPRVVLLVQFCWLLAVLGPAVQPESLRPQVLGNVLVPGLVPLKVACGVLYLLCLPVLMRLWPLASAADRRGRQRIDLARGLCWFPYSALFTTLFFPPPTDDVADLVRFFAITVVVMAAVILGGWSLDRFAGAVARFAYTRIVPLYAAAVLAGVVATSLVMR